MAGETFVPWGKNPQNLLDGGEPYPLTAHLLDTAAMAGAVWDLWLRPGLRELLTDALAPGNPALARSMVMLVVGLHDIGKANPLFQMLATDGRQKDWPDIIEARMTDAGLFKTSPAVVSALSGRGKIIGRRHEYKSFTALTGRAIVADDPPDLRQDWAPVVASGHHGTWHLPGWDDDLTADIARKLCSGGWADVQASTRKVVEAAVGVPFSSLPVLAGDASPFVVIQLVTGITQLADWCASSATFVNAGESILRDGATVDARWADRRAEDARGFVRSHLGFYVQPASNRSFVTCTAPAVDCSPRPADARPARRPVAANRVSPADSARSLPSS